MSDARPVQRSTRSGSPIQSGAAGSALNERRPFRGTVPHSSVPSVRRVARLDGRTRIVAARTPGGTWFRLTHRRRFTRDVAADLRQAGISEVVLRRGMRSTSFPLGWLSQRSA